MSAEPAMATPAASRQARSPLASLRRRDFRILVAGQSLSTLGDMVYLVALPFLILGSGYAANGLSLTLTGFGLARIGTALPGGALADRFGARPVMLGADVVRCAALTALTVTAARGTPSLVQLALTGVVLGACEGAHLPAYRSITPALVPDEELPAANAVSIAANLFANVIGPLTELARPIPAIAIVPVAILLFPTDEAGIVFITFLAAYFPIMVSTRHAVRALPTLWEDSVRTLGGGRWQVLTQVVLPGILPGVFGGLSVGMGVAWICVVSAEMISGRLGVGYRTWQAYTVLNYPDVFVGIITIGVLGFATAAAVELIGRRATRWLPHSEENVR